MAAAEGLIPSVRLKIIQQLNLDNYYLHTRHFVAASRPAVEVFVTDAEQLGGKEITINGIAKSEATLTCHCFTGYFIRTSYSIV
jgi:hypothetical protein